MPIKQHKLTGEQGADRIPLVGGLESRSSSASKDQFIYNLMPEVQKDKNTDSTRSYLIKRPGLTLNTTVAASPGIDRGIYYWNSKLWSIYGSAVYQDTTLTGTTLNTTTGRVGFVECSGANKYLFFCDGTDGYYINTSNTITKITDAQFPTPHVKTPVYLDGYVFVAKSGTGEIYNSALEDPSKWDNELIDTEMYPDDVSALARQGGQVLAFGRMSTEFFYDQANVSTSPLGRTEGQSFQFGTCAPYGIISMDQYLIAPIQSESGGRSIVIFKGFECKPISTEYVDRILDAEGTSIVNAKGIMLKTNGHFLYILSLTSRTLVYDLEHQYWSEWSTNSSGSHAKFSCRHCADKQTGQIVLQHSDGKTYFLDPTVYTDNGTSILCEGTTDKFDQNTMSRKFGHGVYWVADDPGSATTLSFRWSDDDYQTWSSWKTVDLHSRPYFPRMGAFRRRAFNYTCSTNVPLRLECIELVDLTTGVN